MNAVQRTFAQLTDAQLCRMLGELKQLDADGVLPDGETRALATRLARDAGIAHGEALKLAMSEPLRAAAFRWHALQLHSSSRT
ncbi:hypothetical protein [Methylibium petroleiphilum]|uniref:Uncharacterized protein n=1 Tax=Methylibium petroleiphilum (strain ATCC BAA-1232 / LMG 22953 / PM1) TaxID=420662 RepID=A2SN56_METPP|nr:hypothetical protein [Methylibium petroleiphilum]ABM96995.1 hypothetical protein Mpe_B0220 [Methylibium petroleiphilum PM1]